MLQRARIPALTRRCLATEVAARAEDRLASPSHSELKLTRLQNQMMVTSVQAPDTRISKVGVAFKAGSRYDEPGHFGMAHRVATLAGLGTKKSHRFTLSYKMLNAGAELEASHTRDLIILSLTTTDENRKDALKLLGEMACEPGLNIWELGPSTELLLLQAQARSVKPRLVLDDLIHKAAYRGRGLGQPLLAEPDSIGHHEKDGIRHFLEQRFVSGGSALLGLNVDHSYLLDYSADAMPLLDGEAGAAPAASPYAGGEEHVDGHAAVTHTVIASEGASWQDVKGRAAQAVLGQVVGGEVSVPWSGSGHGGLAREAVGKALGGRPFSVEVYEAIHADSGLFGFTVTGRCEDAKAAVRATVEALRSVGGGSVQADALAAAKKRAAVAALLESEDAGRLAESTLSQVLSGPNFATPADLADAINAVTAADVSAAAKKWGSGKPSLASLGNSANAPYLDDVWKA